VAQAVVNRDSPANAKKGVATMRKILLPLCFVLALALGGQALAGHQSTSKVTKVTVAMHDPGCHSFLVGGTYLKTLSVHGPASLLNADEATLIVAGKNGTKTVKVGKTMLLDRGVYRITMVKQAPDDNHLVLSVR
jgi:hypothetical protein